MGDLKRQLLHYAWLAWRRRWLVLAIAWPLCAIGWEEQKKPPHAPAGNGFARNSSISAASGVTSQRTLVTPT